jgi:hypothetical protein
MGALLKAELIKLRTTRTFVAMTAAALGASLLVVVLTSLLNDDFSARDARDLFTADFTSVFILLLGVIGMSGEWRHRTITSSVLAAPDRLRMLAAKVLSYAAAGVVISVIVSVTIMAVGSIILNARDFLAPELSELADVLWRNVVVATLFGAFGVVVGAVVRNQIAAVVGVLVLALMIEPALSGLVPSISPYGPTGGAANAILEIEGFNPDEELLSPAGGVLVLLGWIGLGFAIGGTLLRTRDLNA